MSCEKKFRRYVTKNRLPLNMRDIARIIYNYEFFTRSWKYHFYLNDLQVDEMIFRRVLYDAVDDALKNKYGKIHKKDFQQEYAKLMKVWNENYSHLNAEIADWINYRQSEEYKILLEKVKEIDRFDIRAKILVNNALSYLYGKYQKPPLESYLRIEKKLLGWVETLWSKKWVWFLTTLLVFDANSLYANTIYNTKWKEFYIQKMEQKKKEEWFWEFIDWDKANEEAIKMITKRWYERDDIGEGFKMVARVYENIIVPLVGEVGSVMLAEACRRGTVVALIHLAKWLADIATFHPSMRGLKLGSKLSVLTAEWLNSSILAWLGWQIALEWNFDVYFQKMAQWVFEVAGKMIYGIKYESRGVDWDLFKMGLHYRVREFMGETLDEHQKDIINFIREHGTEKQKRILEKLENTLLTTRTLFNARQQFTQTLVNQWKDINFEKKQYFKDGREWRIENIRDFMIEGTLNGVKGSIANRDLYVWLMEKDKEKLILDKIDEKFWNDARRVIENNFFVDIKGDERCRGTADWTEKEVYWKENGEWKKCRIQLDASTVIDCDRRRVLRLYGLEGQWLGWKVGEVNVNDGCGQTFKFSLLAHKTEGSNKDYLVRLDLNNLQKYYVKRLEDMVYLEYDNDKEKNKLLKIKVWLSRRGDRLCISVIQRRQKGYIKEFLENITREDETIYNKTFLITAYWRDRDLGWGRSEDLGYCGSKIYLEKALYEDYEYDETGEVKKVKRILEIRKKEDVYKAWQVEDRIVMGKVEERTIWSTRFVESEETRKEKKRKKKRKIICLPLSLVK